jgi:hypothetical protein
MQYKNREQMAWSRINIWFATSLIAMFVMTGCGGGDDSSGANSVRYDGNTQAASITESNAREIANETFTGSDAANAANPTLSGGVKADRNSAFVTGKLLEHIDSLSDAAKNSKQVNSSLPAAQVSVEITDTCPVSGSVRFNGEVDDVTRIGSLSVSYMDCNDGDVIVNGSATLRANAYNATIDEYTDVELIFDNLHMVSVDPANRINWQLGANIRAEQIYTGDLDPFTKIATINLTLRENIGGAAYKYEDYVVEVELDQYLVPSTALVDINGRLFHWIHGYVDVETITSLHYPEVEPMTYPDAGGPLVFTGETNKKIKLTPVDATTVNVAADTDGDDFYEYSITVPWVVLKDDRVNNNAPVADAGNDATINLGGTAQLDGSQSTDADYNLITFSWTVIDQPAGSDAGLQGADSGNATVTPDMAGNYTLELMVYDGWYSDVDTVIVTVNP